MCGIVGLYLPTGAPMIQADLDGMLRSIAHRGPDGTGRHVSQDRRFQAGFTRLAIIDLATGDQPLVDGDGACVFLGNGEIYNYREIRTKLERRGHVFKTQGDMEPALRLYQEKGIEFLHDLNGMYGLAVYDRSRHTLLLARDRLGIKPLYWTRLSGGAILFGSEIKALLASGLISAQADGDAVGAYLAHGYVPAPQTLFAGIHKLPPGQYLQAQADGSVTVATYWTPQPALDLPKDATAIQSHLMDLLADSVDLQLRSDVPVGALLSGGVDSGLMVALAASRSDRPLNTYTVRFAGAGYDESPLAAEVANRYGTRHTCFELPTDQAEAQLPALAWVCDEPLGDAALLPNALINNILSKETRVVLNGTGGDELFAGYGRYFQLPVERRYLTLPPWLRHTLIEPLAARLNPMLAFRLARAEKFVTDPGGYLHDHSTQFPAPMRRRIGYLGPVGQSAQARLFAPYPGPAASGMLCADLGSYLAEDLMLLLDRSTMAHSVEGRVPFLDHRLVQAALAVPPAIRNPAYRPKGLQRSMAAAYLPSSILTAPKQGFASPVPAWMAGPMGASVRRLLTAPKALARGIWTKTGIQNLLNDPARHAFRLYALTMLELTFRLHMDTRLDAPPTVTLAQLADD